MFDVVPSLERPEKSADHRAKLAKRVSRTLKIFNDLPDQALIDDWTVAALFGRSRASIWRDVQQGRLCRPVRIGARSARWRVGHVRAALAAASSNTEA